MEQLFKNIKRDLNYYSTIYENGAARVLSITMFIFIYGLAHIFFAFIFTSTGVYEMVYLNIISFVMAMFNVYLVLKKHKYLMVQYMFVIEIGVYISYLSYFLGYNKGAYILFYPLLFAIYSIAPTSKKHVTYTAIIAAFFFALVLYFRFNTVAIYEYKLRYIEYVNILYCIGAIIYILYTINLSENLLNLVNSKDVNRLENLANTDFLTGLYNKRYLEEKFLNPENFENTYIVLADIDHFKKINDTYGHVVGDYTLKEVAKIFLEFFREDDLITRWGGEEFLLVIKEVYTEDIISRLNILREKIKGITFEYNNVEYKLTITFGVKSFEIEQTLEANIKDVDVALYYGKNNGRDKVVNYSPYLNN
ncbi:MAG: GGDEF domain-containing protein [Lachnospirales bacterium]